jgi:MoxR-like ATPase
MMIDYRYSGGKGEDGQEIQPAREFKDPSDRAYDPYFPDDSLIEAVNLSIALNMPLLLEGEPGCGKTRLAGAIAYEFTQKYLQGKTDGQGQPDWWPYYVWNVKSIGRARDGLYEFDGVLRLRDAQIFGTDPARRRQSLGPKEGRAIRERLLDKTKYVNYGPLGQAFLAQTYRPVMLIDEIDKADSDFPNDLLFELDRFGFEVPEAGIPFRAAQQKPIIVITSNRERPLPEAFLRRCLYFWLEFPKEERLRELIEWRFGEQLTGKAVLLEKAIAEVLKMRQQLQDQPGSKPPGTSEILKFMEILLKQPQPQEILENLANRSPFLGILLKTQQDQVLYRKSSGQRG